MKMNQIVVEKEKLLNILKENKEQHIKDYKEAMKGYRVGVVAGLEKLVDTAKDFVKEVEDALEDARNGGEMKVVFRLELWAPFNDLIKPESHEEEYKLAFDMIELDVDTKVELTKGEFKQFVNDEWDWSENFNLQVTGSLYNMGRYGYVTDSIKSYGE